MLRMADCGWLTVLVHWLVQVCTSAFLSALAAVHSLQIVTVLGGGGQASLTVNKAVGARDTDQHLMKRFIVAQ